MTTKRQTAEYSTCRWCTEWGRTTVLVRTVDTYVVVILVGIFHDLAQHHPGMQLWVGFWHREALPLLPHQLNLPTTWGGKSSCCVFTPSRILMQHLTQFCGKARKTYPVATAGFTSASQDGLVPLEFTSAAVRMIERLACIMYNSTTSYDKVNDLRQGASIWRNSLNPITAAANHEAFGWTWEDTG